MWTFVKEVRTSMATQLVRFTLLTWLGLLLLFALYSVIDLPDDENPRESDDYDYLQDPYSPDHQPHGRRQARAGMASPRLWKWTYMYMYCIYSLSITWTIVCTKLYNTIDCDVTHKKANTYVYVWGDRKAYQQPLTPSHGKLSHIPETRIEYAAISSCKKQQVLCTINTMSYIAYANNKYNTFHCICKHVYRCTYNTSIREDVLRIHALE